MNEPTWLYKEIEGTIRRLESKLKGRLRTQIILSFITLISLSLIFRNIEVALATMIVTFIHELGHFIVLKKLYTNVDGGIFFLPFLGAATLVNIPERPKRIPGIIITAGGPFLGLLCGAFFFILTLIIPGIKFLETLKILSLIINLGSLLPLHQNLDGGKIICYLMKKNTHPFLINHLLTIALIIYSGVLIILLVPLLKNFLHLLINNN